MNIPRPRATSFTLEYVVFRSTPTAKATDVTGGFGAREVTVPANARSVQVPIEAVQDLLGEPDETLVIRFSPQNDIEFQNRDVWVTIENDDPRPTASFASASQSVGEGSGTHNVALRLAPASQADFTLEYAVGGTATSGSDYTALSGTVAVAAGATTATIPVTITDDGVQDRPGDETVVLTLSGGDGYAAGGMKRHVLRIVDSQTAPVVSFTSASQRAGEGSGTRAVKLNLKPAPDAALTVKYTVYGSASGSDYTALSGTLAVAAGATTASIPVAITDDTADEGDETVVLQLDTSNARYALGSPNRHTLTIEDDDAPLEAWFAAGSQSADEGSGTRMVVMNLSPAPDSPITLNYTVGGTATAGSDYTALSGTLAVPKGARTASIPVAIVDDGLHEGDETVVLTLAGGAGYTPSSRRRHSTTLTIHANDQPAGPPTITLATTSERVSEGAGTHQVSVNIEPAPTSDIRFIIWLSSFSTATRGDDYSFPGPEFSRWQVVPAGAKSTTVPVTIIDDELREGDERIEFFLRCWSTNGHEWCRTPPASFYVLTIADNDVPSSVTTPVASFASASRQAVEGAGTRNVRVNLSPAPQSAITLSYAVTGTATSGTDYTTLSGNVSVSAGAVAATIPVAITDDSTKEPPETVILTLTSGTGYTVGAASSHTLTVKASDAPPRVSFAAGSSSATEGAGTHNVTVNIDPAPASAITLAYTVGGTATSGTDYTMLAGSVAVSAGAKTAAIPVAIADDIEHEGDETIVLTLARGAGYHAVGQKSHELIVDDDDRDPAPAPPSPPRVSFTSASSSVVEGAGLHRVTLNFAPAPTGKLHVLVSLTGNGGTATKSADYDTFPVPGYNFSTIEVPVGATTASFRLNIPDDAVTEGDETVVLRIYEYRSSQAPYRAGTLNEQVLTIVDNDGASPPSMPVASFASASASAAEGSGTQNVTVNLVPAPAADIALGYTVGGTATSGSDYTALSGTVAVTAGAKTATIPVALTDDRTPELAETVVLMLAAGTGYTLGTGKTTHTLTIPANDPLTVVSFASGASTTREVSGTHDVTLNLKPPPAAAITLGYTVGGTATSGSDYTALSGTVAVSAGAKTATIPVAIIDDSVEDSGETVVLTLSAGTGYALGAEKRHTLTIVNKDQNSQLSTQATPAPIVQCASDLPSNAVSVSEVTGWRDEPVNRDNANHVDRWNRLLAALDPSAGKGTPMTAKEAKTHADKGWARWVRAATTLKAIETCLGTSKSKTQTPPKKQVATPEISISGGAGVTEGTAATFTLTATPAPAAALTVKVTVTEAGGYATGGTQQVTIPTAGTATLSIATTADSTDEPDGSVTATLGAGTGYAVSTTAKAATVGVADDDDAPAPIARCASSLPSNAVSVSEVEGWRGDGDANTPHVDRWNRALRAFDPARGKGAPMTASEAKTHADKGWARWVRAAVTLEAIETCLAASKPTAQTPPQKQVAAPEISIAAGAGVTEGTAAVFTLTANPAPAAALDVKVTVTVAGGYATGGTQQVIIPTAGTATLSIATTGDEVDEADGSVTAALGAGTGYTVSTTAKAATVAVSDDDDAPAAACTAATPPADLVRTVRGYYEGNKNRADRDHGEDWLRVLIAFGAETHATLTPYTAAEARQGEQVWNGWTPVRKELERLEAAAGQCNEDDGEPEDATAPEISIAAGSGVTEGGKASFTVTATPAPATDLTIAVAVTEVGGYATAGTQQVTIPSAGTATLEIATTGDEADEPDGSVTATLASGTGYTVSTTAGAATVAVADDDDAPAAVLPTVSIAAKASSVTEGSKAVFTVTASPAPAAALAVRVTVAEASGSDFVAAGAEGTRSVIIAVDATQASVEIATADNSTVEPAGKVSAILASGTGYTVSTTAGAATVAVTDNDATGPLSMSIHDAEGPEGSKIAFRVTLSRPAPGRVQAFWITPRKGGTATRGVDYAFSVGRVSFAAGESEKTVHVQTFDDAHDDPGETFRVEVFSPHGAVIADGEAIGTILNDDPMPAAWLARFGRTVAEQALGGIADRMAADRVPGMRGSLAGQAIGFDPGRSGDAPAHDAAPDTSTDRETALALADVARRFGGNTRFDDTGHRIGESIGAAQTETMTGREALLGSSFALTGEQDSRGGSVAFWGRASHGTFDGRADEVELDGKVTTGMLGADYARGRWLVGLALARSAGEGGYRDAEPEGPGPGVGADDDAGGMNGRVEASLNAAIPYASLQVLEGLTLWGAAGFGTGEVTLDPDNDAPMSADTEWTMAAAGLRGDLLDPPEDAAGGPALALVSDAMWARTNSEKTRDLAASESGVTRLRVGLEGSWRVALEEGGSLMPTLEAGLRHDGGDAETGFGGELGGGIAWVDPALGLSLDLSGRTCVDAPFDASIFFGRLSACGQVLSCVRPLNAARHTPRALMEMRGPGPYRLRELESSASGSWFSRSRLD